MEVPFHSSGALSRRQYALVRNVELANVPQQADQQLLLEVRNIQQDFLTRKHLSLDNIYELLIILLYCYNTIATVELTSKHGDFDFALSHALTLAEAGKTIAQKRIGYLFCAEVMPASHELHLMLVNTLRKDLEDIAIPRICLSLDNLIHRCTEDTLPAVQSRLLDLLSHNSPHVRRRTLLVFKRLSYDGRVTLETPSLNEGLQRRIKDKEMIVVAAALSLASGLLKASNSPRTLYHSPINNLLRSYWSRDGTRKPSRQWFLCKVLQALVVVKVSPENFSLIQDIIDFAATNHYTSLLRESFLLLSSINKLGLTASSSIFSRSIKSIRNLLTSRNPNDQYLFLDCLQTVEPKYWAGTSPDVPAMLDAWEVERIMVLLDCPDSSIRKKTLALLNSVDVNIVSSYYAKALESIPPLSLQDKTDYALRLLDIVDVLTIDDGESYATSLRDILNHLEGENVATTEVLEGVVERVLQMLNNVNDTFATQCATTIVTFAADLEVAARPTLLVVASALACFYAGKTSVPPLTIILGLSQRLKYVPPSVQDACLLSMLRLSAECTEMPGQIVSEVNKLKEFSGRHIRRRCDQFISLSGKQNTLLRIVQDARSSTLPDFLVALQSYTNAESSRSSYSGSMSPSGSNSKTATSVANNKLRYTAYDSPVPAPRLRASRRQPSSRGSLGSPPQSPEFGHPLGRVSSRLSGTNVGGGELALAAATEDLELISLGRPNLTLTSAEDQKDEIIPRVDLIAFDSPFIAEPSAENTMENKEFKDKWNGMEDSSGARGWYSRTQDDLVVAIRTIEVKQLVVISEQSPPYEGELKLMILVDGVGGPGYGLLRVRGNDDGGCLWRLRCNDNPLCLRIKRLLVDE